MASPTTNSPYGFPRPCEDEQKGYFTGLAGSPRLVARTSTKLWVGYDTHPTKKALSTLGSHRLVGTWSPKLRSDLVQVLTNRVHGSDTADNKGIDWDTFFPIRIGLVEESDTGLHPAVLLVGLRPGGRPCTWETAMHTALGCRDILRSYNILDVEVEIMRSRFVPMASPAATQLANCVDWSYSRVPPNAFDRDLDLAKVNSHIMPLLPFPGCRIEQEEARPGEPEAQAGTLGLYIRLRQKASESTVPESELGRESKSTPVDVVYGLTNRHVAIGLRLANDQGFRHHDHEDERDSNYSLRMLSSSYSSIHSAFALISYHRTELARKLRFTEMSYLRDPSSAIVENLYKMQSGCLNYMDDLEDKLHKLRGLDLSERLVGTVAYSPRYGISGHGHFKDWALVKIAHTTAHNRHEANRVYMAEPVTESTIVHAIELEKQRQLIFDEPSFDKDGFIRVHGHNIPSEPYFNAKSRIAHLVAKRGQRTGLRFGITNEIEAVRRTPQEDGGSLVSYQLLVLDFEGGAFSRPGDSGSCVFDCSGRVVGLVDGGQRAKDVTPSIKKFQEHKVFDVPGQEALPKGFGALARDTVLGVEKAKDAPYSDVTFVTPIQWILEDVREFTGREVEIL